LTELWCLDETYAQSAFVIAPYKELFSLKVFACDLNDPNFEGISDCRSHDDARDYISSFNMTL